MEFRKEFSAKLVNFRADSFTDRNTGEITRFFRLDLIGDVDGQPQALQLTCGSRAVGDNADKFKPGQSVNCIVVPYAKNNRVTTRVLAISPA